MNRPKVAVPAPLVRGLKHQQCGKSTYAGKWSQYPPRKRAFGASGPQETAGTAGKRERPQPKPSKSEVPQVGLTDWSRQFAKSSQFIHVR